MALLAKTSPKIVALRRTYVLPRPVRTPVKVSANIAKDAADGFVRIFTKPESTVDSWKGTDSAFTGDIAHHGSKKPFSDGFSAVSKPVGKPVDAAAEGVAKVAEGGVEGQTNAVEYVGKALESVVGSNFTTKDDSEPDWSKGGSEGWKGDIHSRKQDGFHSKKH